MTIDYLTARVNMLNRCEHLRNHCEQHANAYFKWAEDFRKKRRWFVTLISIIFSLLINFSRPIISDSVGWEMTVSLFIAIGVWVIFSILSAEKWFPFNAEKIEAVYYEYLHLLADISNITFFINTCQHNRELECMENMDRLEQKLKLMELIKPKDKCFKK